MAKRRKRKGSGGFKRVKKGQTTYKVYSRKRKLTEFNSCFVVRNARGGKIASCKTRKGQRFVGGLV